MKITILDISIPLSLFLTGEEGVRTLFNGQRERVSEKEGERVDCTHLQKVQAHEQTALPGELHGQIPSTNFNVGALSVPAGML
jgi:hypothetical protein